MLTRYYSYNPVSVCLSASQVGVLSGVTMGWLLRLVTGGPLVVGGPGSSRVLSD